MNNVIVNKQEVDELLNKLGDDTIRNNLIFKALYSGAKELQRTTQSYFKSAMGESANHVSKYIRKPFYEGVTVSGDKAYLTSIVSIMRDFRMKFFEKGTKERYIKQTGHSDYSRKKKRYIKNTGKSNYRGVITGKHFFKDAVENTRDRISYGIIKSIDDSLKKL